MHVISTQELEHQIRESEEPAVLSEDVFLVPNPAGYLSGLLHRHGSTVQEVVVGCNLDRSYGYQLFNGTRRPTRERTEISRWAPLIQGERTSDGGM